MCMNKKKEIALLFAFSRKFTFIFQIDLEDCRSSYKKKNFYFDVDEHFDVLLMNLSLALLPFSAQKSNNNHKLHSNTVTNYSASLQKFVFFLSFSKLHINET